jgi:tetratricopeptide (TPR) repeat protein
MDGNSEKKISKDIAPILKGWDYEAGTINVRKVAGLDGQPKLQMRLDLGLLQMEMTGRPDGVRPFGHESLLDYYEDLLAQHRKDNGSDLGFTLTRDQCATLREEAVMYYHRYLSLFVLEDFAGVVRDTGRNLHVLDFCSRYATDDTDRYYLEQYRPYIVMMNTRAKASLLKDRSKYREALATIEEGLDSIREFFVRLGQESAYGQSNEVKVLKKFAREIRKKLPVDPMRKLQKQLDRAVEQERYEEAARLRDEINRRKVKSESAE